MRGAAVLIAAYATWVLAGGGVPAPGRLPRVSVRALVRTAVVGVLVGWVATAFTGVSMAGVAVGLLAGGAVTAADSNRAARNRERLAEQWPDFLAILRSRLASGNSLDEAFVATAEHLDSSFAEIGEFAGDQLAQGARFDDVLTELRDDLDDPLADRVLTTISAAHASGGHRVSEILASLGMSVADDLRLRKAHEAALTQQRLTAAVALIAPWALLVLTITTNPQAASIYASSDGSSIILLGLAGTGLGYALARRTARLSQAPRLFR